MKNRNISDIVAQSMDTILNSQEHKSLFYKKASGPFEESEGSGVVNKIPTTQEIIDILEASRNQAVTVADDMKIVKAIEYFVFRRDKENRKRDISSDLTESVRSLTDDADSNDSHDKKASDTDRIITIFDIEWETDFERDYEHRLPEYVNYKVDDNSLSFRDQKDLALTFA